MWWFVYPNFALALFEINLKNGLNAMNDFPCWNLIVRVNEVLGIVVFGD